MRKKSDKRQKYYFSDRLKRQLVQISHHPLTVVAAPSGFGKTTAVREYLKENLPDGACEYWYTCLGESASIFWTGICDMISNLNKSIADDLKNLKIPTKNTLFYMISYLKNICCHTETYIVIDNYQLVDLDIFRELVTAFSMHGNSVLHIIFITQQMDDIQQISICNDNIHVIDSSAFLFDKEGIKNLFRMKSIRLTDDEAEKVFISTEGWIAAIRLQMISFIETGSFTLAADIDYLVEHAIWDHFDLEEKEFLLSISVLDGFTIRQATVMMNKNILPNKIRKFLKNNDFIRYMPDKLLYSIHSILRHYLRGCFYNQTSKDYQNQVYRKLGEACAADLKYCLAAEFYYKIEDFDAILSMPFTREHLEEQKEKFYSGFCATLIKECPNEILCKYPFTMIVFGYMTLMNGYYDEYEKLCRLLCYVIQNGEGYSQKQLMKIEAEYTLLEALGKFNDINKMKEGQNKYRKLLGTSVDTIKINVPWLFGSVSVLNMLWREEGKLKDVLQQIGEGKFLYHRLVRGYGAGSYYTMQAEMMLMRGEDNEAEILSYKALHEARSYKQTDICLCIELVLARIAILRGDVEAYFNSIKRIKDYSVKDSRLYIMCMVEHCMSIISFVLDDEENVSPWFYDMENIKKTVYAPVVPHAQLLHLWLLLRKKRYNEFYAICEHALNVSGNSAGNIKYIMPQVYQLIFLAMAKRNNGRYLEAQEYLKEALTIALQDQIYLPFAQQGCMTDILPELSVCFYDCIKTQGKNSFTGLMELCKRQKRGVSIIRKSIVQYKSPLTPREREIAMLAKERLSSKEIAAKLYISEMTVRATIRSVYSKLDIHSRAELYLKEF